MTINSLHYYHNLWVFWYTAHWSNTLDVTKRKRFNESKIIKSCHSFYSKTKAQQCFLTLYWHLNIKQYRVISNTLPKLKLYKQILGSVTSVWGEKGAGVGKHLEWEPSRHRRPAPARVARIARARRIGRVVRVARRTVCSPQPLRFAWYWRYENSSIFCQSVWKMLSDFKLSFQLWNVNDF